MKVLLILAAVLAVATAANWGVLIAGSNGYGNYRHQSDICHAFQILTKNGVPAENIIVFMYDDIANYGANPYKGKIFNKPTAAGTPGVDVYAGVNKDYTGSITTAANLLAVLQGDASKVPAGHKVLKSGPNDNVFVYYSDHGGTGLVAMPAGPYLYATDLNAALKAAHQKGLFKNLVFYLEACESGSMFDKLLPANIDVYATTASNPTESSWGWYCSPEDMVDGKHIGSCLGDEYSIQWMEDSDLHKAETLQEQFQVVQKKTTKSHVCEYGDMGMHPRSIWDFQGKAGQHTNATVATPAAHGYGVNSRDVQLHYLFQQYSANPSKQASVALQAELSHREKADTFFHTLARTVMGNEHASMFTASPRSVCDTQCCQPVMNYLKESCDVMSDYSLQYVRSVVNMCEQGEEVADYLMTAVKDLCH